MARASRKKARIVVIKAADRLCGGCKRRVGSLVEPECGYHGRGYAKPKLERSSLGNCGPVGKFYMPKVPA